MPGGKIKIIPSSHKLASIVEGRLKII